MIAACGMFSMMSGYRGSRSLLTLMACLLMGPGGCSKAPPPPTPTYAQPTDAHSAARSGNVAKLQKLIDDGADLALAMLRYGISAITLETAGSRRTEGLRACVSLTGDDLFGVLEERLVKFHQDH